MCNGCNSKGLWSLYFVPDTFLIYVKHLQRAIELLHTIHISASLIAQLVKNPPAMQETLAQFLGWKDLMEKG